MEIYDYTVEKEESGIRIGPLSWLRKTAVFPGLSFRNF